MKIGSNRSDDHHERSNEDLGLFLDMQKRERERKSALRTASDTPATPTTTTTAATTKCNYNTLGAGPLSGSAMEANLAARLASSSLYRNMATSKYTSTRTGDDLLTSDVGKDDYDWLMTPPATPLVSLPDDLLDATVETTQNRSLPPQLQSLAILQESASRLSIGRSEPTTTINSKQLEKTSINNVMATRSDHVASRLGTRANNHARPAISTSSFLSTNSTSNINNTDRNYSGNRRLSSSSQMVVAPHSNNSITNNYSSASNYSTPASSRPASKQSSSRTTTPTSRSSTLPSIITSANNTSSNYNSSIKTNTMGNSSATTTPRMGTTTSARQSTAASNPLRKPTTPTLSQSQTRSTTSTGSGNRSTSIGRGAINTNNATNSYHNATSAGVTNKPGKGSKSTSSSRTGSPVTTPRARPLLWEPSEMPGFSIEAPPNLRTTVSERSTSTSRGSRQPATPTANDNSNDNNSRSRSASKGRFTSSSGSKSASTDNKTTSLATSRGTDNKGASNNIVLGSKMVEKVMQARRAAAASSLSSSSSSSSSSLSHVTRAESVNLIPLQPEPKPQLQRNNMVKQPTSSAASTTTSLFKDTNPGFNSSRVNDPSKAKAMLQITHPQQGVGENRRSVSAATVRQPRSHVKLLNNTTNSDNIMRNTGLSNLGHSDDNKNQKDNNNVASIMMSNQKQQQQQQQYSEESSDFSSELNAIMRQDNAHCGSFPSKDIIKANNIMRNTGLNKLGRSDDNKNQKDMKKLASTMMSNQQYSEESSDFSSELDAIMRQGNAHCGSFPSKDMIRVSNNWMMNSPDYTRDDSVELMHLFRQGIEKYGVSESPLVCQHGAPGNCEKCNPGNARLRNTREVWKASPLSGKVRISLQNPDELWKASPF